MTIRIGDLEFTDVLYDEGADVLYLSSSPPQEAADSSATPEGHAVRYDEAGNIIGVTIVNAKWLRERDGEVRVTLPRRVDSEDLDLALA